MLDRLNTQNKGGEGPHNVSSSSRTTSRADRTCRARKALRTEQAFWTRVTSISLRGEGG